MAYTMNQSPSYRRTSQIQVSSSVNNEQPVLIPYSPQNSVYSSQSRQLRIYTDCSTLPNPRSQRHHYQHVMAPSSPANYALPLSQIALSPTSITWAGPSPTMGYDDQNNPSGYNNHNYSPSISASPNEPTLMRSEFGHKTPRSVPVGIEPGMRFFAENILVESPHGTTDHSHFSLVHAQSPTLDQCSAPPGLIAHHLLPENQQDLTRMSIGISDSPALKLEDDDDNALGNNSRTSKAQLTDMSDLTSREMTQEQTSIDLDEQADEPYAKLIHRALMSRPSHTMLLREIYQWFRENTSKGSGGGKGWMNSIRHNLSMNAAFTKTERKVPGDELKKSTEWVLEPFAVDGREQTSWGYRYRSRTKKFTASSSRYGNGLQISRPTFFRRGGTRISKIKVPHQKQQQRVKTKEDALSRINFHIDTRRRQEFHQQTCAEIARQRSPLTPPLPDLATNPYFVSSSNGLVKFEQEKFESPYEDHFNTSGFGTQGVYPDGHAVFSDDGVQWQHGLSDSPQY